MDQSFRFRTNAHLNFHLKSFTHFLWLIFIPLLFCCNAPPPTASIHTDKLSTEAFIINHQTLTPGFGGVDDFLSFHGITAEGMSALEGGEGFEIHCLAPSCPLTFNHSSYEFEQDPFDVNLYMLTAGFSIPGDVEYPVVMELEFRRPTTGEPIGRMNYRLQVPDSLQVKKYAEDNATQTDILAPDLTPGAMAFIPKLTVPYYEEFPDSTIPKGRYGYLTLQSGGIAVWDTFTDTETFQQPAYSDLAVVNYTSNSNSILLGNGNGGFQNSNTSSTGSAPRGITLGEFNGDGTVDQAIASEAEDTLFILLGRGDGNFDQHASYAVGESPRAVKTGDFDNDGLTDLVVANYGQENPLVLGGLTILFGDGSGNFPVEDHRTVSCSENENPSDVLVTRLNFNIAKDLVVALEDSGKVASYLGTGDRNDPFPTRHGEYDCGSSPVSLAAGRFDQNWTADITVANHLDPGTVSWLLGDGLGGFGARSNSTVGSYPIDVVTGSFNRSEDEWIDLVVANEESQELHLLKGDGTGSFGTPIPLNMGSRKPTAIAVGHFDIYVDENEYPDLAVTAYDPANNDAGYILSIPGTATGLDGGAITEHAIGQDRPINLAAFEFDHQFTDAYLLPNGRNCGYGVLILPEPVSVPYDGCDNPPCKAYLFVTNHTVDPESLDIPNIDCQDLTIDGKPMADIVTVYEIDPAAFTPLADRPFNDTLVASIRVGCGPQGIAVDSSNQYIYVSDAYEGTVTVIDFGDCGDPGDSNDCLFERLPLNPPETPISDSNIIKQVGLMDSTPGPGETVINRSISTFQHSVDFVNSTDYAWVTVNEYWNPGYPGALILLDLTDPWQPTTSKIVEGVGEFTIGVAVMPEGAYYQTVVVSDGHPDSDPNECPDSVAFLDSYNLINNCIGEDDDQACYATYMKKKSLGDGKMSGSIAFRRDGHRAYVYRQGDSLSGLLVIDARPGVPLEATTEPDETVLGVLNLTPSDSSPALEVFWAEMKHEECVKYDGDDNCILKSPPKLYLSAINDTDDLKGLWQRPEPLVIPGPPYSVEATSDDAPSSDAYNLERTFYIQDGGIVFNDELTHAAFSVETTPQKSDYPGDMDIIVKPLYCNDHLCEEGDLDPVSRIESVGWTNITSDNTGTDFSNTDAYPNWSPKICEDIDCLSYHYYFLFVSGMDMVSPEVPDTDLYVIKWDDPSTRINLMDDPKYCDPDMTFCGDLFDREDPENSSPPILDSDPHWYYDESVTPAVYRVVYTRRMPNENSAAYISEIWTMDLDSEFNIVTDLETGKTTVRQLTNPCYPDTGHSEYYVSDCSLTPWSPDPTEELLPYGDYDPRISPLGGLIAFERQIGPGYPSDWDIIVVSMDFKHWSPVYEGEEASIWNITQHFDDSEDYYWSAEFIPYWKPSASDNWTPLTYTLLANRTDYIADDFRDQFVDYSFLGGERHKRPLELPHDRSDNLIDGRGGWFPDADLGTANPELVFFREIGSTAFVAEQAKRIPGR